MITAMSLVKMDTAWVGSGTCGWEWGVRMKFVIADCSRGCDSLLSARGGDSDTDLSFACTERGEGGCTTTTGPVGGVGG